MWNKTILFVANYLGLGGTERTIRVLAEEAIKAGYTIHIGSLSLDGERYEDFNALGQWVLFIWEDVDTFKNYCQLHEVDILHWHSLPFSGVLRDRAITILVACRELWIRIIHTSPFSLDYGNLESLVDQTVFVSQNSLLKFAWKKRVKTLNKAKHTFIYNPIDVSSFSQYLPSHWEREKLREKYGIPKNAFLLIKNCRPDIWKWDWAIVDCLNNLWNILPDLHIAIQSPPRNIRKRLLKNKFRDRILILDHTKDDEVSSNLYKIWDLCVHTSRIGESFGISMIEAMYFGVPVLTMDTDFMRHTLHDRDNSQGEIIIEGKTGYIFDAYSSLYEKVRDLYFKVWDSPYSAEEIRAIVIERFEPRYIFSQYEDIYNWNSVGYYDIQAMTRIYKNRWLRESILCVVFENLKALITRILYV